MFQMNKFEEISILIHKHKEDTWVFTVSQFKTIIEKEELELILIYLKKRECRRILDTHSIQKKIVQRYLK
jgi:hypothetical protein